MASLAVSVVASVLAACGGTPKTHTVTVVRTTPPVTTTTRQPRATAPSDRVLSVSGLGTFHGRCPRGARSWTLRFVVDAEATDTLSYWLGGGPRRTVNVNPGEAISLHLAPGASRTREPRDRFVPPLGQGRGRADAMVVPTTQRLHMIIYQGSEPQTLRADVSLALATIGGESGQCVLVGSTVNAYTYPNS